MDTPGHLGFFDLSDRYDALTQKGDSLEQLATHIPWARFRKTLEQSLGRSKCLKGGRPPFDAMLMFKVLVLQALYNLSDDQTKYQFRDWLSFMRFLGLDLHQRIPDAKTIWLFPETLTQAGVVEKPFTQFDTYLTGQGLPARGGQLIDASLIPVRKQRNTREEKVTVRAGDCPADWEGYAAKRRQKDRDARWAKKHGPNHFGFKNHVNVDKPHKLIWRYKDDRCRRAMTVKSSRRCCRTRPPVGTCGAMPPIARKKSKSNSRNGSSARRFSTKRIEALDSQTDPNQSTPERYPRPR